MGRDAAIALLDTNVRQHTETSYEFYLGDCKQDYLWVERHEDRVELCTVSAQGDPDSVLLTREETRALIMILEAMVRDGSEDRA